MKRSEGETYKTDEISDLEEGISLHDPELEAHKKKEYFMWECLYDVTAMSPRCQLNEPMSLSDDEQKAAVTESYTRLWVIDYSNLKMQ